MSSQTRSAISAMDPNVVNYAAWLPVRKSMIKVQVGNWILQKRCWNYCRASHTGDTTRVMLVVWVLVLFMCSACRVGCDILYIPQFVAILPHICLSHFGVPLKIVKYAVPSRLFGDSRRTVGGAQQLENGRYIFVVVGSENNDDGAPVFVLCW